MPPRKHRSSSTKSILALGVGSFALGMLRPLRDAGAKVSTYLTRAYGHYPPTLVGPVHSPPGYSNPAELLTHEPADLVIPQSIDWASAPWAGDLLKSKVPIFCARGDGMLLERERDFARRLCHDNAIAFPKSFFTPNRDEALRIVRDEPRAYVIKNPLCSPSSPIHTILCRTAEDTRAWLNRIDDAEGIFLQEYLGHREAGHLAVVSGGRIHSLATNQEYKRAFTGGHGVIAGAPLGGVVEADPQDRYGLARSLLHPLLPWFKKVHFNGPVQATAVLREGIWNVIEYNIRLGVTSGPLILRMLKNPIEVLLGTARNEDIKPDFRPEFRFGCSITLAGYGYPYVQLQGPSVPIEIIGSLDGEVVWNEADLDESGQLLATGHRIVDSYGLGATLDQAVQRAYANLGKIRCLGSYYRTDIGKCLWPPGCD